MLQISRSDVADSPFPHVVKQGILPEGLFERLHADFPNDGLFREQGESSTAGSRVGKGTGFDIYRGDTAYDRLVASSDAWKELDAFINSPAFVEKYMEVFGPDLIKLGSTVEVDPSEYDRDLVEGREALTEHKTIKERVGELFHKLKAKTPSKVRLFTRLDIERGTVGYDKPPHCDRANRLCSLIIYFTDLEAEGIEGGELNIYKLKEERAPSDHARHPKADEVDIVATLSPKKNLGVFFPCSNNSYHGVNAIRTPGRSRDFLYINISTDSNACW